MIDGSSEANRSMVEVECGVVDADAEAGVVSDGGDCSSMPIAGVGEERAVGDGDV